MLKKKYSFYSKNDPSQEPIASISVSSRLEAAKHFAQVKQMPLKVFLTIFTISK